MDAAVADERTDAELASLAAEGDLDAFEQLYRRYFSRVFDFAARSTRNRADAGDVAQDTFIRAAEKIGQLRDPDAFRSWLFSIARRRILNLARAAGRTRPESALPGQEGPGLLLSVVDADRFTDPVEASASSEVASLVWEAASALDERTYTVLDLHVRQGLDSAEIADVMGVTKNRAYVMVHRMKERVGGAISAYLLIRKGSQGCPELATLVADADLPPVDAELKRRVDRHVEACDPCQETRRRLVAPMNVLAALAHVAAEVGLEDAIWERVSRSFRSPREWTGRLARAAGGGLILALLLVALVGVTQIAPDPVTTTSSSLPGVAGVTLTTEDTASALTDPETALAPTTAATQVTVSTTVASSTSGTAVPTSAAGTPPTRTAPTTSPTTTAPPTTAPPTTTPPADTVGPTFSRVATSPTSIWEESASRCPTTARLLAAVVDESGVASVQATWTLAEGEGGTSLVGDGTYVGTFGPIASPQTVLIEIVATDAVGNRSATTLDVVVLPASDCR